MEGITYFFFSDTKVDYPNSYTIGKKGDYKSLEKFLEKERGEDIYKFTRNHEGIQYFNDSDIFITFRDTTPLDLRLREPTIPPGSRVISSSSKKYKGILEKLDDYVDDYPIFSGSKILSKEKEVKERVLENIVILVNVTYQMLDAGYLELENNGRIDDWIVTFQEPILDIFIRYHRMPTSAMDLTTTDEFIINPEYRRNILIMMMKILANFSVHNLNMKDHLKKIRSWEDHKTWNYLRENVKLFKY